MNRNKILSKGLIDKIYYIFIIEMKSFKSKSFKSNLKINYVIYHLDKQLFRIAVVF